MNKSTEDSMEWLAEVVMQASLNGRERGFKAIPVQYHTVELYKSFLFKDDWMSFEMDTSLLEQALQQLFSEGWLPTTEGYRNNSGYPKLKPEAAFFHFQDAVSNRNKREFIWGVYLRMMIKPEKVVKLCKGNLRDEDLFKQIYGIETALKLLPERPERTKRWLSDEFEL